MGWRWFFCSYVLDERTAFDLMVVTFIRGAVEGKWTRLASFPSRGQNHWKLYLLTPWCSVLLEQLTGLQPVKKFPAFHGTRRFITALTSIRHLSVSWASPIHSTYPHPTSWRSILILSTHLRLGRKLYLVETFRCSKYFSILPNQIRPLWNWGSMCFFSKRRNQPIIHYYTGKNSKAGRHLSFHSAREGSVKDV